ncbi:MAG: hypothetical protein ACPF8W_00540 [Luminiphilus sp.]
MADLSAGALTVSIEADIAGFERTLDRAEKAMQQTREAINRASQFEFAAGDQLAQSSKERLKIAQLELNIIQEQDQDLRKILEQELKIEKALAAQADRRKLLLTQFDQQVSKAKAAGAQEQQINALLAQQRTILFRENKANEVELARIQAERLQSASESTADFVETSTDGAGLMRAGFLEATGAVQKFQSNLGAALGVVAGFAAAAQLIGGVAKGLREGIKAAEEQTDAVAKLDKGVEAFLAQIPVFNQFAAAGRELAFALGLAADEAEELAEATRISAAEQKTFEAFASNTAKIAANEISILKDRGQILAADLATAKENYRLALEQVQAIRFQASESKRAGIQGSEQLKAQADQLERQAELQLKISEAAARRAQDTRENESIEETNRLFSEAQQRRAEIVRQEEEIATARKNALDVANLELQIAQAKDKETKKQLEDQLDILRTEQEFAALSEEINQRYDARGKEIEKTGEILETLQENEQKRVQELDTVFKTLDARLRASLAAREASLKTESKITKEKKKQLDLSKQFDTAFGAFELFIPQEIKQAAQSLPAPVPSLEQGAVPAAAALEGLNLEPPMIDLAALTGTISTAENRVGSILENMLQQDQTRNNLLQEVIRSVKQISSVGTSGAFI